MEKFLLRSSTIARESRQSKLTIITINSLGAYNSLFYLKDEWRDVWDILYIANLIQYHMQPYFIQTEKAKQKFIGLVGEDMYKDIMILHEADKEAH